MAHHVIHHKGCKLQGSKVDHAGEDPYITLEEEADDSVDDRIKASDLLVLAAKTDEDSASLEVWLFDATSTEGEVNAYVHHDIMLPAFPLSVAWLDCSAAGVRHISLRTLNLYLQIVCSRHRHSCAGHSVDCSVRYNVAKYADSCT